MKFLKKLWIKIVLFFYMTYLKISIAISNFEKGMRTETHNKSSSGSGIETNNFRNNFLNDLYKGDISKEQKDYFYKILKGADMFMGSSDKNKMMKSAKDLGMSEENEELFEFMNTNMKIFSDNKTGYIDNEMNYPIEHIITNGIRYPFDWDYNVENRDLGVTTIKYDKKDVWVEDIIFNTSTLHVKNANLGDYILEFYVPEDFGSKMYNIEFPVDISFTDKYGDKFEYVITDLLKIKSDGKYSKILIFKGMKTDG